MPLHVAGGLVLLVLALRLARSGTLAPLRPAGGAYLTTLALGLGNRLTIVYFTAAVAAGAIPASGGALMVRASSPARLRGGRP